MTTGMGLGLATAAPAFAGGVGAIASPALDNACATVHHTTDAVGQAVQTPGLGSGVTEVPMSVPFQHCGGADLPDPVVLYQVLSRTPMLAPLAPLSTVLR
ncbi:chaplin family protein [Streptomyces mashuensis]|uniref:chaplin family protein n=1 Tax=Streptomyces mashuensis TaxID=33904 RepID=UPI00167D7EDD|nr:chaplin family protein [Streptomyces mashuensis]